MARLPTLVCGPVGRPVDRSAPVRFPDVDLAPALAAFLVAGGRPSPSEIMAGRLSPALVAAADPRLGALAWQGLLVFERLFPEIVAVLEEFHGPGRPEAFVEIRRRMSEAAAARDRLEAFVARGGRLAIVDGAGAVAFDLPDSGLRVAAREIGCPAAAPFAVPVWADAGRAAGDSVVVFDAAWRVEDVLGWCSARAADFGREIGRLSESWRPVAGAEAFSTGHSAGAGDAS